MMCSTYSPRPSNQVFSRLSRSINTAFNTFADIPFNIWRISAKKSFFCMDSVLCNLSLMLPTRKKSEGPDYGRTKDVGPFQIVSLHELSCSLQGMRPGIVGMSDQSAIRAYQTCPRTLGNNSLAIVISIERRSFWRRVDNVEAVDVPDNCQHRF
jgi:hypothetical protein